MEDRTSLPSVPTSKTPGQVQDAANTTGTKSEAEAPKEHGGESLEDAVKAADRVGGAAATPEAKAHETEKKPMGLQKQKTCVTLVRGGFSSQHLLCYAVC